MDSEKPRQPSSVTRDWLGQYSDVSSDRIPVGGAEVQSNCFSLRTGELTTRGGIVEVSLSILDE